MTEVGAGDIMVMNEVGVGVGGCTGRMLLNAVC